MKKGQDPQHIHPNTVRAALGSATLLHSFLLPKAPPEPQQISKTAPEQTETTEPKDYPQEEKKEPVMTAIEELTKEVASMKEQMAQNKTQTEIAQIRTELEKLLKEEGSEDGK